mmetsp:Transcript_5888/g.19217  ORF Transcript_5888/g.19217 Transcript_5888/m.19217 type:complete len:205 (-) Transcript_5888:1463-2077(-)
MRLGQAAVRHHNNRLHAQVRVEQVRVHLELPHVRVVHDALGQQPVGARVGSRKDRVGRVVTGPPVQLDRQRNEGRVTLRPDTQQAKGGARVPTLLRRQVCQVRKFEVEEAARGSLASQRCTGRQLALHVSIGYAKQLGQRPVNRNRPQVGHGRHLRAILAKLLVRVPRLLDGRQRNLDEQLVKVVKGVPLVHHRRHLGQQRVAD